MAHSSHKESEKPADSTVPRAAAPAASAPSAPPSRMTTAMATATSPPIKAMPWIRSVHTSASIPPNTV